MSAHRDATTPVRRRHLFFIAGFDRKSPRWYQALYRNQARRQQAINGLKLEVSRERLQPTPFSTSWQLNATTDNGQVETVYEVLQWDDIVRKHWANNAWQVLFDGIRTVSFGLRDGAVQRMYRLYRPPVYATFLPLVVLLVCVLLAAVLGFGIAALMDAIAPGSPLLANAVGAAAAIALITGSTALVHRIQITWLLRLVRFAVLQARDQVPMLDERLTQFAERINAVADPGHADGPSVDEILIVGHSVGATLALSVIARLLDRLPSVAETGQPSISLLSLGHCIPLHSALGPAQALRQDLQRVAHSTIDWLDITAPIDWAAFPSIDPISAAGLPAAPAGWHPRLVSPRFHQLFGAQTYAELKRNRFKVHMQYLMASERLGTYDYFAITAGPQRLRARFDDAAAATAGAAVGVDVAGDPVGALDDQGMTRS